MPVDHLGGFDYRIEAAILAAGNSRRFGAIKQVHKVNAMPLLQLVCNQLKNIQAELTNMHIMLGANAALIQPQLRLDANYLYVEQWQNGMSESIKKAVLNLGPNSTHLLICLGDQVAVSSEDLLRLIIHSRKWPDKIICAQYSVTKNAQTSTQLNTVPAVFPRAYFSDLLALTGDKGARALLSSNEHDVMGIDMPSAAIDIDTPADLAQLP